MTLTDRIDGMFKGMGLNVEPKPVEQKREITDDAMRALEPYIDYKEPVSKYF